jgi:shikimate kinase
MTATTKNIVLTGPPGSGKTTVGRMVADAMKLEFVDMDLELERKYGCSVSDYFAEHGEAAFRKIESILCGSLSKKRGLVIATGGGVLLDPQNRSLLESTGTLVNLHASVETLVARLNNSNERPLLNGDLENKLSQLLENRRDIYSAVKIQINVEGLCSSDVSRQVTKEIEQANR